MKYIQFISLLLCSWSVLPCSAQVLDDICERTLVAERTLLQKPPLRETDVFWEKRVWRVIDVREKMNLPFMYPLEPFFKIITDAAEAKQIDLFTVENDQFTYRLDNVADILYHTDTTAIYNPDTGEIEYVPYTDEINYADIKRFRIKEVWFFNSKTSRMEVRVLGIAPLREVYDEQGNFRYEQPLFWVYYPQLEKVLAQHKVFTVGNDAATLTWADLLERRQFASYIYKASNVQDLRLQDVYSGVDRLLEGDKIQAEIFNFEHDLWSY